MQWAIAANVVGGAPGGSGIGGSAMYVSNSLLPHPPLPVPTSKVQLAKFGSNCCGVGGGVGLGYGKSSAQTCVYPAGGAALPGRAAMAQRMRKATVIPVWN